MPELNLSDALRNARGQLIIDAMSAGAIEYYAAPKPAKGVAITTQTKLATLACETPSGSVSNGEITFNLTDDLSIDATGDVVWARGLNSVGDFVFDADVSLIGSGAVFEIANISVQAGGALSGSLIMNEGNL